MPQTLQTLFILCAGASIGAMARFALYAWVARYFSDTYWATLSVNVLGSLLIGVLFVLFREVHAPRLQLLLLTGLLASFTTFSTLSLDAVKMLMDGQLGAAFCYAGGQLVLGVGFCYFGVKIAQRFI